MQSRIGSVIETATNIVLGFIISLALNGWVLPLMGYHITMSENLVVVTIFTVVSMIRSYVLRRFFNLVSKNHGI
jgi:hypothetical protein